MQTEAVKPHVYHLGGPLLALSVFNLLFVPGMMCLPATLMATLALTMLRASPQSVAALTLAMFLGLMALFMLSCCAFVFVTSLVNMLWTYVKVSAYGIEYRAGWRYGVRTSWAAVERIGEYKSLGLFRNDVLYLRLAQPIGPQVTLSLRRALGLSTPLFVALGGMAGWPTGALADDLKRFAPQLFVASPLVDGPRGPAVERS